MRRSNWLVVSLSSSSTGLAALLSSPSALASRAALGCLGPLTFFALVSAGVCLSQNCRPLPFGSSSSDDDPDSDSDADGHDASSSD